MTMNYRLVRIILGIVLLAGLSRPAAAQKTLVITLTDGTVGAKCMADMSQTDKMGKFHTGESPVVWEIDGTNCRSFNYRHVALQFDTDVMNGGRLLGNCVSSAAKKCKITDAISSTPSNTPNHSRHPYVILFNGRNAGDPEIDINNDTGK
jgi:hypothetical protein